MSENTSPDVDQLRRQVEELQRRLSTVQAERDEYKAAAYQALGKLYPYVPPTDEELHELMHGPRGRSLWEIVAEAEKELAAMEGKPDGGG